MQFHLAFLWKLNFFRCWIILKNRKDKNINNTSHLTHSIDVPLTSEMCFWSHHPHRVFWIFIEWSNGAVSHLLHQCEKTNIWLLTDPPQFWKFNWFVSCCIFLICFFFFLCYFVSLLSPPTSLSWSQTCGTAWPVIIKLIKPCDPHP